MNLSGLCMCGCGQPTTISKRTDWPRHQVKGQPMRYCHGHGNGKTWQVRFWEKISKSESCWLWLGAKDTDGYGRLNRFGKRIRAHQLAWIIHKGPIPKGLWVLHTCDNPACVKPDHLFLGTSEVNTQDMVQKNRQAKGSRHGIAKLSEPQVLAIRALRAIGWSQRSLGRLYQVDKTTIALIEQRQTWRHV